MRQQHALEGQDQLNGNPVLHPDAGLAEDVGGVAGQADEARASAEARALHDEGLTMAEIAALFGVSRQRVSALLRS